MSDDRSYAQPKEMFCVHGNGIALLGLSSKGLRMGEV